MDEDGILEEFISNIPLTSRNVLIKVTDLKFPKARDFAGTVRAVSLSDPIEAKSPYQNLYLNASIQTQFFSLDDLLPLRLEFRPSFKLSHILFEAWEWVEEVIIPEVYLCEVGTESQAILPSNFHRQELILINNSGYWIWIGFGESVTKETGYPMHPGKEYHRTKNDVPFYGPISAIAETPTSLLIIEFS